MPTPLVRQAVPGDARKIAGLYQQLVNNPAVSVLPERIDEVSRDRHTRLLVCEYLGEVCGSALLSLCDDVMFGHQPFGVVENVVVASNTQNKGLGLALMRHIEAICIEENCSKIMLLSSAQRAHAHHFFERIGFEGSTKRGFVKYRRSFASA